MSYFKLVPTSNAKAIPENLYNNLCDLMQFAIQPNWEETPLPWDANLNWDEDGNILIEGYMGPGGLDLTSTVTIELKADEHATSVEKFNDYYHIECGEYSDATDYDIHLLTLDLAEFGWNLVLVNE